MQTAKQRPQHYGRRNGAKFNESKSLPTSTTNLRFNTFFFYINNKIRPTSTINIIINIPNMLNSTIKGNSTSTKIPLLFNDDLPHNQHRTWTLTRKTRSTIWGRTTSYGRGRLGPRNSNHRACWEIET